MNKTRKIISTLLATLLLISYLPKSITFGGQQVNYNSLPQLLITEIAPDTKNISGSDGYEYIEIYNNTNQSIDLKGYKFIYFTTSTQTDWDISDECIVDSKGVALAWITNSANVGSTVSDFIDYANGLGHNVSASQVVRVPSPDKTVAGMANNAQRSIALVTDSNNSICEASYTKSNGADITLDYKYPDTGTTMILMNDSANATPATITSEQVPDEVVDVVIDTLPPVINHTPITTANAQEDLVISAQIQDQSAVLSAQVLYSLDDAAVQECSMSVTDSVYEVSLSKSIFENAHTIKYKIQAEDSYGNIATTDEYLVTVATEDEQDFQKLPPLIVTELLPDSDNVGGSDGYEFIEIYNNTNKAIQFKDYKILYYNIAFKSDTVWASVPDEVEIGAGETLVFWIINSANTALTVDDFNTYFGTHLVEGQDIVRIYSAGMSNSDGRGVKIITNTKIELSTALYNENGADNVEKKQGIQYVYDLTQPNIQRLSGLADATPGVVSANQKPTQPVKVVDDISIPVISLDSAPEIIYGNDYDMAAVISDDNRIKTVKVYIKSNLDTDYTAYNITVSEDGSYHKVISAADLTGKKYYDFYFTASDGTNVTTSQVIRAAASGIDLSPVRLNVNEGDIVSGQVSVIASADTQPNTLQLHINHEEVTNQSIASLEKSPYFAFEATGVDTFFRNGVVIGEDVLKVFDDGIYTGWETISTEVNLDYIIEGQPLTVSVYAGTKAKTGIDLDENNDDFIIKNLRLILPDGRQLMPQIYSNPDEEIQMGDSTGKHDYVDCVFDLPQDAFKSLKYQCDTSKLMDGPCVVEAINGTDVITRNIQIDNAAPDIVSNMNSAQYKGLFTINASATDEIAGVKGMVVTLDGRLITVPYETSSVLLTQGEHTVKITAVDHAANTMTKEIVFTTPKENPEKPVLLSPEENQKVTTKDVTLTAKVSDSTNDPMNVKFKQGYRFLAKDKNVISYDGATKDALEINRIEASVLTPQQLETIAKTDNQFNVTTSRHELPYALFEVTLPDKQTQSFNANVTWQGSTNPFARTTMYVYNDASNKWDEVIQRLAEDEEVFTLSGDFESKDRVKDSKMTILIQHTRGYAGTMYEEIVASKVNAEDTPRQDYDFTFAWESDTQYYNEEYYQHQLNIHNFILNNRERMNIQYLFHTGDIVDEADKTYQWENADVTYKTLDEAGLPYGVLAGNHDVGHKEDDYTQFYKYFGEERYNKNPWYGENYKNNRGHYDLISVDGVDFMMLYMGWDVGEEEIQWMNEVIKKYPERKVILNFHEYILTTGGLGVQPQQIYEEVVKTNPNVCMVFCGHYHDAYTRVDEFDDDHDGVNDRKVYQILFDYQGLSEGGLGYLRLMHFSLKDQKIICRTYSPSLDDYNADDSNLDLMYQDYEIPFSDLGIAPKEKRISTDSLSVDIYTDKTIASFENVESASELSTLWTDAAKEGLGWYVEASDNYGGLSRSQVRYIDSAFVEPVPSDDDNDSSDSQDTVAPSPTQPEIPTVSKDNTVSINGIIEKLSEVTVSKQDGKSITNIKIDEHILEQKYMDATKPDVISIALQQEAEVARLELNGQTVKALQQKDIHLQFINGGNSYKIAASEFNLNEISAQLGNPANLSDIKVFIEISKVDSSEVTQMEKAARKGGFDIVVPAIEFKVNCIYNNQTFEVKRFASYVQRSVQLPKGIDLDKISTAVVVNKDGTLRHVPTKVQKNDGKYYAIINSLTNSIYEVIYYPVEFDDTNGHWAKQTINDMASRMILKGVDRNHYLPDAQITRAEFAAIVVKALGLEITTSENSFADVKPSDWYCGVIQTAVEYGIIAGYEDGAFRPNDKITREQAMLIVSRTMKMTDLDSNLSDNEVNTILLNYSDVDNLSEYAKTGVAGCIKTETVLGRTENELAPKALITRAEAAVILQRLLKQSGLI